MTHTLAAIKLGLRLGRWLLPWVAVAFTSATLAYAVTGAVVDDRWAADRQPTIYVAVPTDEVSGPLAGEPSRDFGSTVARTRCAPIGAGFVDSLIVAEMRAIECGYGRGVVQP